VPTCLVSLVVLTVPPDVWVVDSVFFTVVSGDGPQAVAMARRPAEDRKAMLR